MSDNSQQYIIKSFSKNNIIVPYVITLNGYDYIKRKNDKKSIFAISHDPCKAAKLENMGKSIYA